MLRIYTSTSSSIAKNYFSSADYYTEGQELQGLWRGRGAERLGLSGEIEETHWHALCDNLDPGTGRTLTLRQKSLRRVGYDFTFDVPKSVSLLYGLTGDERVLDAFRSAVDDTMRDIEAEAQCRVRKGGKDEDRTTGNLIWGQYVHFTSRPVDGVPDPQLHAHCFVFNATFDEHEQRWKAVQVGAIKRDAPYFQAAVDARMAKNLAELGLSIQRARSGWELHGTEKATLDKFSRRTAQIERLAEELGITDPRQKAALGAQTRERKAKQLSMDELRGLWRERLTGGEAAAINGRARAVGGRSVFNASRQPDAAREAIDFAAGHCFERSSVVPERVFLAHALRNATGAASLSSMLDAFRRSDLIKARHDGRAMVTTHGVLRDERRMAAFARDGRGSSPALGDPSYTITRAKLNTGQRAAIRHLLTSRDRVMLIRGAAGTGKTTMMQEAAEAIRKGSNGDGQGKEVFVFAPSADASRDVLRSKGFMNAETVAHLLNNVQEHEAIRGQVIWIDEAGLVGTPTMAKVFDLAGKLGARVILSGDPRQHGSVERGAALHLLESEAGVVPAEIKEIVRQKDEYLHAVEALSEGRAEEGFQRLDDLGWIREIPSPDRARVMAKEYVAAVTAGKTALVISPTHAEGNRVTQNIRAALRDAGRLGKSERRITILRSADLTEAQRRDAASYTPESVLVFHQNAKGYGRGQRVPAADLKPGRLPLDQAERFQVYQTGALALASGDLVRITRNGFTADRKHALHNGNTYAIRGFTRKGDILLANGWTVARDYGHLAYGYVSTSHASQGKDVQRVLVAQSSESFAASSKEQFYVSVSRGTEQVSVYTDDKAALLENIGHSDARLSATELLAARGAPSKTPPQRMPGMSRSIHNVFSPQRTRPFGRTRIPLPIMSAWKEAREQHGRRMEQDARSRAGRGIDRE